MLTPLARARLCEEAEQKLRGLETRFEKDIATGDLSYSKGELQNLELQLYSLNRDLASIANEMACTLFSYYYQAALSKVEGEHGEAHQ